MQVTRNNISSHRVELSVEISADELAKYAQRAAVKISESVKIEGFRPGKAPYERVKTAVGEMAILEEAARLVVTKTLDQALTENVSEDWVGQPEISITKLAPQNALEYRVLVTLLPRVELGTYKGLGLEEEVIDVTDAEVDTMIGQLREFRVTEAAVDRASANGDKVVADVNLYLDKVPVEGGQTKETAIILGKDYFVPGFDEHVKGMKAGETREFFVTYPNDHGQKNLAGKKVEFKVTVKQVYSRELPALDDAFVSVFGLKTVDELRANIRRSIQEEKRGEAAVKFERGLLEKIVAASIIGELPDTLVKQEAHTMLHELEHNVQRSGAKFDEYLTSIGKTSGQLQEEFKEQAVERLKATLVIRQIVLAEKISVTDEDLKDEIAKLKLQHAADPKAQEALANPAYARQLKTVLLNRRVLEKLREWNLKKAKSEKTEAEQAPTQEQGRGEEAV